MLYRACEVCGEKFNVLRAEDSENKHSIIWKCSKYGTKYKTPQIDKKKFICL